MVLIHRGRGYVVLIAGVVAALLMNMFTNALFHDDREYYGTHVWPKFGTLWVAGLLCVAAGAYLRKHPTRVIDKDSIAGESARSHHLVRETRPLLLWQAESFFLHPGHVLGRHLLRARRDLFCGCLPAHAVLDQ